MRFVVADDGYTPRERITRILKQLGHEVVGAAKDGAEALEMVRKHKPDAVILDIIMPKMTGTQVAQIVLEDKSVKHVFLATLTTQDSLLRGLENMGAKVIAKPYVDDGQVGRVLSGLHKK